MSAPLPNPSSPSRAAAAALPPGSALLPPRSAASRSPPAREAAHPFELPSSDPGNLGRTPAQPYSDASGAMSRPPANSIDHPCGETPPHLTPSPKIFSTRAAIVRDAKQGNAVAVLGPVGSTSSPASLPGRTSMCPPVCMPTLLNSIISDSWSDEELMQFLAEDFLPENVIVGIDVSLLDPQDSCPGNIWYLNWSDDQQSHGNVETDIMKTKKGYWKCKDVLRMPTSTSIVGVKYNLEFYEGEAPSGKRTQWVMHEYKIEQNDAANVPQVCKSLRTIFLQGNKKLNTEDGLMSLSNATYDSLVSYLQLLAEMEERNIATNCQVKDVLLPWYKLYMFLVHNAKKLHCEGLAAFSPIDQASPLMSSNVLDRWLHSVTNRLVSFVREEMDCGRLYTVVPYFAKYIENLAQIYVHFNYFRLVGHSGRKDHIISLSIIYHALVTTCLVMAPITSIPAEVLYQNLLKVSNKSAEIISFCNFP